MVLASGVFDGLHAGHVAYLESACGLCDPDESFVVAVACDAYVRRHKDREPRWTVKDRMRVVGALSIVDLVVMHDADGVASVVRANAPTFLVKGEDWRKIGGVPADVQQACDEVGTVVLYVEEVPVKHNSQVTH